MIIFLYVGLSDGGSEFSLGAYLVEFGVDFGVIGRSRRMAKVGSVLLCQHICSLHFHDLVAHPAEHGRTYQEILYERLNLCRESLAISTVPNTPLTCPR